ncbi:hypothetical protein VN97_g11781 [Penicillium thymicola]|uniref:Uncharacterized protein n=1 Tax=Penicillium thymicola TaxID=293382 RepID=A0AAI9T7G1_PENTH|nr:hypothetical protein VN97_g11781 [Penicillium thymicola]
MPICNAAIQLTVVTFHCEGLFPHGGAFPHAAVGVHDAPHWVDKDTTCGELGVFGKGGGKNENLEVIARSTHHYSRGILPQPEGILGTCHIPRHSPAISNEVKGTSPALSLGVRY